jgi:hypothetical protein
MQRPNVIHQTTKGEYLPHLFNLNFRLSHYRSEQKAVPLRRKRFNTVRVKYSNQSGYLVGVAGYTIKLHAPYITNE